MKPALAALGAVSLLGLTAGAAPAPHHYLVSAEISDGGKTIGKPVIQMTDTHAEVMADGNPGYRLVADIKPAGEKMQLDAKVYLVRGDVPTLKAAPSLTFAPDTTAKVMIDGLTLSVRPITQ